MVNMNIQQKSVLTFKKALTLIHASKLDEAEKILRAMLRTEPKATDIRANLGYIEFKRGNYIKAHDIFADVLVDDPNDPGLLNRFAAAAMHTGKLDEAEQALLKAVELVPEDFDSWMNLCALAGFKGKDTDGMRYATKALSINPRSPGGYVNLGSCLQMCNKLEEASYAFETAIILDPKQLTALINLGVIAAKRGNDIEAIAYFDKTIAVSTTSDIAKINEAKFYKSISLLKLSHLQEAWQLYDCGFFPSLSHGRSPRRSFGVPQWGGESLAEHDTLLCWKEQGIGDELMFLSCLPELESRCKNIIVECDERLVEPLSRSFPNMKFRVAEFFNDPQHSPLHHDYTCHIPIGSMFGIFRPELESFSKAGPIVQPLEDLKKKYESRIGKANGRLKVGICWRSGMLSPDRNNHYTAISDWEPIFKCRDDVDFFSLQYGDCSEEIANANQHFDMHINRWPDIDYKNSFEDLFALASAMDIVITVGTAVSTIAAAVGTRTILMSLPSWTTFGTDKFLPFPAVDLVQAPLGGQVKDLIPLVTEMIRKA